MSLSRISPIELTLVSTIIGILIARNLDQDGQNSIGNFLENIAQVILTIQAQGQLIQDQQDNNNNIESQINMLKKQIELLEMQFK